jgi:type IV pilus assembly protein PilX
MTTRQFRGSRPAFRAQQGIALIVSLILLTIMTLVGMAGIRTVTKEERMVAQVYDRSLAFQAAESALREAETKIENAGRPTPAVGSDCTMQGSGTQVNACGSLVTATVPRWINSSFTAWENGTPVGTGSFSITPAYFVEYLGNNFPCSLTEVDSSDCKRYRISARAKAGSERASVVLQTIYATYDP